MTLLDTHAWLWFLPAPDKVPPPTLRFLEEERRKSCLLVSAMSCWELALLTAKGKVRLSLDVLEWISRALSAPGFREVPISYRAALEAVRLPGILHRDPVDRILVATARELGVSLLTRDQRILDYPCVRAFWIPRS